MSSRVTRRSFLKAAAAAGAASVFVGPSIGRAGESPNNKLNIACIGVGGRGGAHVGAAAGQNLVALCDADEGTLNTAAAAVADKFPNVKKFTDYREMFDKAVKDFDAVFVATPDHHHAFATMLALKHKKHVYCEKPLTHSVWEARQMALAARQAKVATQMGNQGNSSEGTRLLCEWVWAGAIGKVTEAHVWTDRPVNWWPQGVDRPPYTDPVPAHLKWDVWLGPAPERPFCATYRDGPYKGKQVYHPFVWRGWWDFGTGALGDIACHAMAPVFWALKLGLPTAVEAKCEGGNKETYPVWSIITYEFPARGDLPPVKLVWYDGKKLPPRPPELGEERNPDGSYARVLGDNGVLLVGDQGKMLAGDTPRIIPEAKMKEFKRPEPSLPRVPGNDHHEDWFIACRGGRPASSNFDFAGPLAEAALVGNIAIATGKRIEWDGPAMKAKNCPEAARLVHREYRKGWSL